jgi:hypothetical protein
LTTRLLHDAVLAASDDAHPTQVANLGAAYNERVDVEPAPGENPRYAREHTGLVLHETVQHVPVWGKGKKKRVGELYVFTKSGPHRPPKKRREKGEKKKKRGIAYFL